jgi:hypothetical protein
MNPSSLRLKQNLSSSETQLPSSLRPKKEQEFPFEGENDLDREIERNQAQQTSRVLEGIFGLPGDLINFAGSLFGKDIGAPGSEKLREISEESSGGYTKPQSDVEENLGNFMQEVGLFALPGAKHYSLARNLGIPVVSELAKEGLKYLGADEKKQAYGKIGTMIMLDLLSHRRALGSAKEYSANLFKQADEAIPKGLSVDASKLSNSLNELETNLLKGGSRPSTPEALKKIEEIREKIQSNGKIDLKELVSFRPSINEWIEKAKGFEVGGLPDKLRRKMINNLQDVKGEVIKTAEEYGKKYNPEYLKLSQAANESWAAVEGSNKIANFIEKKAGSKIQSHALKAILGIGGLGGLGAGMGIAGAIGGAALGGTGALGYKAFKTILRGKSPTLRKHYFNILEGASKGNASLVLKNVKELDKHLLEAEQSGEFDQED